MDNVLRDSVITPIGLRIRPHHPYHATIKMMWPHWSGLHKNDGQIIIMSLVHDDLIFQTMERLTVDPNYWQELLQNLYEYSRAYIDSLDHHGVVMNALGYLDVYLERASNKPVDEEHLLTNIRFASPGGVFELHQWPAELVEEFGQLLVNYAKVIKDERSRNEDVGAAITD